MSEPFTAEVRIFAGNFAPRGWAFCNGQLLPISQNTALFSLIGTTYGGDGRTTTALPNIQGRSVMHPGRGPGLTSRRLGQKGGTEMVSLTESQMPSHKHSWGASSKEGQTGTPNGNILGAAKGFGAYSSQTTNNVSMGAATRNTGGSQPHNNLQPFIALNYIIALVGLYPSRS